MSDYSDIEHTHLRQHTDQEDLHIVQWVDVNILYPAAGYPHVIYEALLPCKTFR
jgi:hypothetical protein